MGEHVDFVFEDYPDFLHSTYEVVWTGLSEAEARAELERNEDWIEATFNTTSRPYFRPPNGTANCSIS